jgi:hypothetical protein
MWTSLLRYIELAAVNAHNAEISLAALRALNELLLAYTSPAAAGEPPMDVNLYTYAWTVSCSNEICAHAAVL